MMLIIVLIVFFSLATIHFSHVLLSLYFLADDKLSIGAVLLRPMALCIMVACVQYYILSLILGFNIPAITGLALVGTNSLFFIGFYSAYKAKCERGGKN